MNRNYFGTKIVLQNSPGCLGNLRSFISTKFNKSTIPARFCSSGCPVIMLEISTKLI